MFSFSSAGTGLNSQAESHHEVQDTNEVSTPWGNTYAKSEKSQGTNNLLGEGGTGLPGTAFETNLDPTTNFVANWIFASWSLGLDNMSGDIFAQALLGGQFTVPFDAILDISVPYSLLLQLDTVGGALTNYGSVTADLFLGDFNNSDPSTGLSSLIKEDVKSLSGSITGPGTLPLG